MGDNVKKQLLDLLAEDPTTVLSTAYVYANNYMKYGEDVTKVWTTTAQQLSILQQVRQKTWAAAYDSFKEGYEAHLKTDTVAMLEELMKEMNHIKECEYQIYGKEHWNFVGKCQDVIQEKINSLKAEIELQESEVEE